jgi:cytochrome c
MTFYSVGGKDGYELDSAWMKAVVTYFKVLSRHFPARTEEIHERHRRQTEIHSQDLQKHDELVQ